MTKILSLLLSISTLFLLLAGCGAASQPEDTTVHVTEATQLPATSEPATEPTLSPEEQFRLSLPETLRQAYDLGLADETLLQVPEKTCTMEEAAGILQKIYTQTYGEESWILSHAITEENAQSEATRGWLMTMMYAAEAETLVELESEDYEKNLKQLTCTTNASFNFIADTFLRNTGYVYLKNNMNPSKGLVDNWSAAEDIVLSYASYHNYGGAFEYVADLKDFDGDSATVSYVLIRFDRETGEKLMTLDENACLRFTDTMTVQEALEIALRYGKCLEPAPRWVSHEEVGTYDTEIIPSELLNRESGLPEPCCQHLPAQWHGIAMRDMGYSAQQQDFRIYEYEIQAIADAGFNMITLPYDFQVLYGPTGDESSMNENRLKELDQILAWCMERDIHLNLSCLHSEGWPDAFDWGTLFHYPKNAEPLAAAWKALARRYADIPNTYLSFTLFGVPCTNNEKDTGAFFAPIAEAIREEDPDRCLIANIVELGTGEAMAALGVALASPCTWPDDHLFSYFEMGQGEVNMQKASWPYERGGKTVNADAAMANAKDQFKSPDAVAAVAKEYGVGYMVSEWGLRRTYGNQLCFKDRLPDEAMEAYLTDMSQTMAERGYGWCYTNWFGFAGIATEYPLVHSTTYTQMPDSPLYLDEEMMRWFQQLNAAN